MAKEVAKRDYKAERAPHVAKRAAEREANAAVPVNTELKSDVETKESPYSMGDESPVELASGIKKAMGRLNKQGYSTGSYFGLESPKMSLADLPAGHILSSSQLADGLSETAETNYDLENLTPAHYAKIKGLVDQAHGHFYKAHQHHENGDYVSAHKSLLLGTKPLLEGAITLLAARTPEGKSAITSGHVEAIGAGQPTQNAEGYSQKYLGK